MPLASVQEVPLEVVEDVSTEVAKVCKVRMTCGQEKMQLRSVYIFLHC